MHLEHLLVEQFRCIGRFSSDLPPGRILIVGDNAQGKTTLLESIFYLVTGRSFRTRTDAECVPWGGPPDAASLVRGRIRRAGGDSCRLAVTLTSDTKIVRIDDQPLERLAGLWGHLRAVLFTPDDLQLVKGSPTSRRRYLDIGMSQISGDYLFHLQRYSQALRQRNALLKRYGGTADSLRPEIEPWDSQLAEHGTAVLLARRHFLRALEPRAAHFYDRIAEKSGEAHSAADQRLELSYASFLRTTEDPDPDALREQFLGLLHDGLDDDLRRGQTERGPHRDDFIISLGGKTARDYGSQGQIRSCVMALRLAEMTEMQERTGDSPLLLLDDLASELDPSRKEHVLELLDPAWQTFMTTTRPSDFPGEASFATVIHLPGGPIS